MRKTKEWNRHWDDLPRLRIVGKAALAACDVIRDWVASIDGIDANDKGIDNLIRMTVVRGVYLWLAAKQGVAELIDVPLPDDKTVVEAFYAALEPITFTEDQAELLSAALEPLARKDDQKSRGAHFTPRSLAGDIVATTFRPLFETVSPEKTLDLRVADPAVGGGVFLLEVVRQLGDRLVACGKVVDVFEARRLVAIHCVHGVDKDVVSVECTKMALRIECRAFGMPWDWLEDNIKLGDSLVGLTNEQIKSFTWANAELVEGSKSPIKDSTRMRVLYPLTSALVDRATALGVEVRKMRMEALDSMAASPC